MNEDKIKDLIKKLDDGECLIAGSDESILMNEISKETRKLTFEINTFYHSEEEVRSILSKITEIKLMIHLLCSHQFTLILEET